MKHLLYSTLILTTLAAAQQPPVRGETNAFRTEEHAYLVHPLEDLGLEGVVSVEGISENVFFFTTLTRESRESRNEGDLSPAVQASVMRIDTRRQVILPVPEFRARDFFRQPRALWSNGVNCLVQFPLSDSDPGTIVWVNTETLRITSLPGAVRPIGMLDSSRLVCLSNGKLVAVNQQGSTVREWDTPESSLFEDFDETTKIVRLYRNTRNPEEKSWFLINLITGQAGSYTLDEFRDLNYWTTSELEVRRESAASDSGFGVEPIPIADESRSVVGQWWRIYPYLNERSLLAQATASPNDQGSPRIPLPHELPRDCPAVMGGTEVHLLGKQYVLVLRDTRVQIRRIQEIPLDEYEEMIREEYKQKALLATKRVGTAMHIYASDYGDNFPLNAGWKDNIQPYLKDYDAVLNFVYLGNGGSFHDYGDTAQPIGYIDTPYGRAVLRTDSSAGWVPRP